MNAETKDTFSLPTMQEIFDIVQDAKENAIALCNKCGMNLSTYDDGYIVKNTESTIEIAENESEIQDPTEGGEFTTPVASQVSQSDAIVINEDFVQIQLRLNCADGLPIYEKQGDSEEVPKKPRNYQLFKHGVSSFVRYENSFIRKTTALYLGQENCQVSNDRLLRVRRDQPDHLFSVPDTAGDTRSSVHSGDLCGVFERIDKKKEVIGRVIQFSYLDGSKRDRQYSSNYVDLTKNNYKTIGVFANWYIGVYSDSSNADQVLPFRPLEDVFTVAYLPMEQYVGTISDDCLVSMAPFSFGILYDEVTKIHLDMLIIILYSSKTICIDVHTGFMCTS